MIKKFIGICALTVVLAVVLAPVAKADGTDTFTYVVSTGSSTSNTFVWQLPSSPTPIFVDPMGFFFAVGVSVSENGKAPVNTTFDFYTSDDGGGFDSPSQAPLPPKPPFSIDAFGNLDALMNPTQVFSGIVSAPTFVLGTYSGDNGLPDHNGFTDFAPTGTGDGNPGTLTITGSSTVPEPSTIGSLAIGFLILALGYTFKRVAAIQIQN